MTNTLLIALLFVGCIAAISASPLCADEKGCFNKVALTPAAAKIFKIAKTETPEVAPKSNKKTRAVFFNNNNIMDTRNGQSVVITNNNNGFSGVSSNGASHTIFTNNNNGFGFGNGASNTIVNNNGFSGVGGNGGSQTIFSNNNNNNNGASSNHQIFLSSMTPESLFILGQQLQQHNRVSAQLGQQQLFNSITTTNNNNNNDNNSGNRVGSSGPMSGSFSNVGSNVVRPMTVEQKPQSLSPGEAKKPSQRELVDTMPIPPQKQPESIVGPVKAARV